MVSHQSKPRSKNSKGWWESAGLSEWEGGPLVLQFQLGGGQLTAIHLVQYILNHLTMDYWNTMEEYILLDKVYFLVNL